MKLSTPFPMVSVRRLFCLAGIVSTLSLPLGCAPASAKVSFKTKPADAAGESPASAVAAATGEGPAVAESAGGVGDLQGTIVFDGAPAAAADLVAQGADVRDKAVCAATAIPNETLVVDSESKGVANVFVFLEKAPAGVKEASAAGEVVFDQKGCRFKPHAILVRTGQTVLVLNDDSVAHNTHTFPERNSAFNQGISTNERKGVPLVYSKPEKKPLEVKCDFHPWMIAYHLPLDHSFAALTDAKGKFEIKGLPAGTHKFKIWHEKGGMLEREYKVIIKGGETNPVTITFGAAKFASFSGPRPDSRLLSAVTAKSVPGAMLRSSGSLNPDSPSISRAGK